jgi:hypothetical protein
VLAGTFLAPASAEAQNPDADEAEEEPSRVERFEVSERAFESWVFRYGETGQTIRAQLEGQLKLQIDDVDRTVKLGEEQRKKLELAGRGDIKRYFEDVEVLRRRFRSLRRDQERLNELWREIQPLQSRLAAGLFGEGSLFRKSLRRTLNPEKAAPYEETHRARRAFRHRAEVEWLVAMLENVMPLSDDQRQKLEGLLVEQTRPPRTSGDYDPYVILWQVSRIPEDKLKPIFDEAQWQLLNRQFAQMKGVWQHLQKIGRLAAEGDPAEAPEEAPAPAKK